MKKTVWIMNHYATEMLINKGGRHYWIAKELKKQGYNPIIFSCNTKHGVAENYFESDSLWNYKINEEDIPFVIVKSTCYESNGLDRIKNMIWFSINLVRTAKQYAKEYGKPDIIIASSVHPLTVYAGEYIARKFRVPCICEIRDLWPESIFAYYPEKREKWYAKILLAGEKYMYKKADAIVMTWEGGPTYISEMGWESEIPLTKISHICNGVSLKEFKYYAEAFSYEDEDLEDTEAFKVVYTGAIRHVNKVDMLVDVADIIAKKGNPNKVKILIWGDGDKADEIKKRIKERDLDNIVMKGKVSKQYIPSILSQGDCSLLHNASTSLDRFGHSQNKFFEYLAAEKPILMTYAVGYSIIQKYNCGIQLDEQNAENIASCIDKLAEMSSDKKEILAKNASIAAEEYDYSKLTKKLISIMESL